jgi:hypothetical protein
MKTIKKVMNVMYDVSQALFTVMFELTIFQHHNLEVPSSLELLSFVSKFVLKS